MLSLMRTIELIPTRDDTGGVRTHDGGKLEFYFTTIENLEIKLWNSRISPEQYRTQLRELRRGQKISIPVTEAQWKAFYR